jgi:glycosyltransferase involved in cell wall biosynthesis
MKIVLVGPTYPFKGGIAHYTTLLYRALQERHRVKFYSFTRQYPTWLYPGSSDRDPSTLPIEEPGAVPMLDPLDPISWWRVATAITLEDPDLIIFPWWVPFWAPVFWSIIRLAHRKVDAPVLFLCHNVLPHEESRLAALLSRAALQQGDYFLVHSSQERQKLLEMFPSALVKQNPHPTYAVFGDAATTRVESRTALGLRGDIVLFFGFVREYKGLRYLFQALPAVLKEHPVTLLVVGEFWNDAGEYIQLANQLGIREHVRIIDVYVPNEEVASYFLAADLVVLPYATATGSGVAQIALGLERPVIVTDLPGLAELVEDGVTGLIVPPGDSASLAQAILRFLRGFDREQCQRSIALRNEAFSWQRMVEAIESFDQR